MARRLCCLMACVLLPAAIPRGAIADPFDWSMAEVRRIEAVSRGGDRLVFRIGSVAGMGGRLDSAVDVEWVDKRRDEPGELLREMTDTRPRVAFASDRLVIRWTAIPAGARGAADVVRCWRLRADPAAFVAVACNASPTRRLPGGPR